MKVKPTYTCLNKAKRVVYRSQPLETFNTLTNSSSTKVATRPGWKKIINLLKKATPRAVVCGFNAQINLCAQFWTMAVGHGGKPAIISL